MRTVAIVLAAGRGSRMGGNVKKQYLDLNGQPILWHSLSAFEKSDADEIILVCSEEDIDEVRRTYMGQFSKLTRVVSGGRERYHSVYAGLCAIGQSAPDGDTEPCPNAEGSGDSLAPCDIVMIHDGARPFVDRDMIARCLEALKTEKACVAAMPSKDTVKIADADGYASSTPDRSSVWIVQTPQCFRYDTVKAAYDRLIEDEAQGRLGGVNVTDDAMVVEMYTDAKVKMVEGSYNNIKITTPEDMLIAEVFMPRG